MSYLATLLRQPPGASHPSILSRLRTPSQERQDREQAHFITLSRTSTSSSNTGPPSRSRSAPPTSNKVATSNGSCTDTIVCSSRSINVENLYTLKTAGKKASRDYFFRRFSRIHAGHKAREGALCCTDGDCVEHLDDDDDATLITESDAIPLHHHPIDEEGMGMLTVEDETKQRPNGPKKILEHIPGFSDDEDDSAQPSPLSPPPSPQSPTFWGLRARPYLPEFVIEEEPRTILHHTHLTPPPRRGRRKSGNRSRL
ncbi:hypothetical protein NLJ89_g8083 [Agrocybe chaxingu]|uniref:Uncharacterized protein n=1 Tax=Agrocybe chaxingu TaxID=84603 RepID=A0A9W8JVK0_9AGAR|nr:hypothetical protein NLJ89_g8083 [Agrocybe chaxingu]